MALVTSDDESMKLTNKRFLFSFYSQVDSAEKLGRLLNVNSFETCVLVQKALSKDSCEEIISENEDALIDFCEEYWDALKQPIVQLPDT